MKDLAKTLREAVGGGNPVRVETDPEFYKDRAGRQFVQDLEDYARRMVRKGGVSYVEFDVGGLVPEEFKLWMLFGASYNSDDYFEPDIPAAKPSVRSAETGSLLATWDDPGKVLSIETTNRRGQVLKKTVHLEFGDFKKLRDEVDKAVGRARLDTILTDMLDDMKDERDWNETKRGLMPGRI